MNKNPFYEIFKGYIPKLIMIIFILICCEQYNPIYKRYERLFLK